MAVTLDLLGQQVRCPHCQQIVLAPADSSTVERGAWSIEREPFTESPHASRTTPHDSSTPGAPVQQPDFSYSPPARDEESIFSKKAPEDDLFGEGKPPALEIPAEPSGFQTLFAEPKETEPVGSPEIPQTFAAPAPTPEPGSAEPTVFSDAAQNNADSTLVLPPEPGWPPTRTAESQPAVVVSAAETEDRRPTRRAAEGRKFASTVLIFLIPYALFMTFVAAYFYFQLQQTPPHPLEFLPDWPGENPGTKRTGSGKSGSLLDRVRPEETKLPARLRVALNKSIQIGSLQVTPLKVEKRRITYRYDPPSHKPETSRNEALVLTLRLKNTSADEQFYPTDPGFNPKWDAGKPKPYTFLEIGSKHFFGGPIDWQPKPPGAAKSKGIREFVDGQEKDQQPLSPQEERVTVITTNPDDTDVLSALKTHTGPLLWRVQLRRGLVKHKDKEYSVSAVVGVEFSASDIH
jgi:hypothetical protein